MKRIVRSFKRRGLSLSFSRVAGRGVITIKFSSLIFVHPVYVLDGFQLNQLGQKNHIEDFELKFYIYYFILRNPC